MRGLILALGMLWAVAAPAQAEIVTSNPNLLELRFSATIAKPKDQVWRALRALHHWTTYLLLAALAAHFLSPKRWR